MFRKSAGLAAFFCAIVAAAQTPREARFTPVFENAQVAVYSLELPARARATVFQGTHDVMWIALNDSSVRFARHERSDVAELKTGDVRFFPEFQLTAMTIEHGDLAKGILVEVKTRGGMNACGCSAAVERSVCGCNDPGHLPPLWALGFAKITLGGTTLRGGQSFLGSSYRDDMLMIAVSDVALKDDAATQSTEIRLTAGEARWIPAGAHQFRNLSDNAARFVTVEF